MNRSLEAARLTFFKIFCVDDRSIIYVGDFWTCIIKEKTMIKDTMIFRLVFAFGIIVPVKISNIVASNVVVAIISACVTGLDAAFLSLLEIGVSPFSLSSGGCGKYD